MKKEVAVLVAKYGRRAADAVWQAVRNPFADAAKRRQAKLLRKHLKKQRKGK